jgi:hypothetical protein
MYKLQQKLRQPYKRNTTELLIPALNKGKATHARPEHKFYKQEIKNIN